MDGPEDKGAGKDYDCDNSRIIYGQPRRPLHYGAAVKLDQKWPTLTNNFSMDFDHRVPKFGIQLPQLPNFPNKYKC